MTARFASNFATLLIGAGLVVSRFAFGWSTTSWVALGAGAAAVIIALWAFALRGQGATQRWLDVAGCAVGAWAIVASRCYSASPGLWLAFASGTALAGVGGIGLLVREARLRPLIADLADATQRQQPVAALRSHDGAAG